MSADFALHTIPHTDYFDAGVRVVHNMARGWRVLQPTEWGLSGLSASPTLLHNDYSITKACLIPLPRLNVYLLV